MARFRTAALYALILLMGLSSGLEAYEVVRFVGIDKIEPMSWNRRGKPAGFICDLVHEIARKAEFDAKITLFPFKRALKMIQEGEADGMISLHYKAGRKAFALYPDAPLYKTRYCVFASAEKTFSFTGVQDLYGKRVGKMSAWFLGKAFEEAVREGKILLEETTLLKSNLLKLDMGRLDAYLGTYFATHYEIKKLGLKGRIVALPESIREESVYMVLSRKGTRILDKTGLLDRIEAAIVSVQQEGRVERLTEKYLE